MNREEALILLRGGPGNIKQFNETRPRSLPDLRGADLDGAKLFKADLSGADLRGAKLCRAELYWADLCGADLREADLRGSRLSVANLRRANLFETDLSGSCLRWADLRGARLDQANFRNADLTGASLIWADLIGTDLSKTKLSRADFRGSRFGNTVVACSLSEAKALEEVEHWGPSHISAETIARSKGHIPENFLRGCGLTECEIRDAQLYAPDLTKQDIAQKREAIANLREHGPIFTGGVFICYSDADALFVDKLEKHFHDRAAPVWRRGRDTQNDQDSVDRQFVDTVRPCDIVLLILSENSGLCPWVKTELMRALDAQHENPGQDDKPNLVLCPIALDDSWKALTGDMSRLFAQDDFPGESIINFSGWQNDRQFADVFDTLLCGLTVYHDSSSD